MYRDTYTAIRQQLPDDIAFNYYPDRQSPWLLAHLWDQDRARVPALRQSPMAKLLDRPALKPLIARCGGDLRRMDVLALAHADRFDAFDQITPAGEAALEACWADPWLDFHLTFEAWGMRGNWEWAQVSREGGSLVIQLGFPGDHAQLMGRYLPPDVRGKFQEEYHPVRTEGRPTLAWARVDLDLMRGEALIEEIQCDWLRLVQDEVEWLAEKDPQSRDTRAHQAYQRALFARYARLWPQAMMLAALVVLVEHLGIRRVWMHQPAAGAVLKGIDGCCPPVSLYTKLPRSFCFAPTTDWPALLAPGPWARRDRTRKQRAKQVQRMADAGRPIFWRLDVSA